MSLLLSIGEGDFFVSCLLHLSPEDLKACRLVSKTWNEVIKERVWGNKRARKRLEEKLVHRWKTQNPQTVRLGPVYPSCVQPIICNNAHVFCGVEGKVRVYSLADGQWVRDLEREEEDPHEGGNVVFCRISCGESIVAALMGHEMVTIWSSKEEMGRLHSFDVRNHEGAQYGFVADIKVTGNKVVLMQPALARDPSHPGLTYQLVVLQESEHNWENKSLEPFSIQMGAKLAVEKDWLAVGGEEDARPGIFKVKVWKMELFRQDIELPGVSACDVDDLVLESPFLVVPGHSGDSESGDRVTGWIKVFQLADDNLMEDLNSAAILIKTVQFPGFSIKNNLLCTGLVWGCLLTDKDLEFSFVLIEKTELFDAATPPEETKRNMIQVGNENYNYNRGLDTKSPLKAGLVAMNTTSLVFIQRVPGRENWGADYVCKKDFWMSNIIS